MKHNRPAFTLFLVPPDAIILHFYTVFKHFYIFIVGNDHGSLLPKSKILTAIVWVLLPKLKILTTLHVCRSAVLWHINHNLNKRTTYNTLHACFFTFQSIYCRNPRSLWQQPRRVSSTPWGLRRGFS